jgi:hypothetical protein
MRLFGVTPRVHGHHAPYLRKTSTLFGVDFISLHLDLQGVTCCPHKVTPPPREGSYSWAKLDFWNSLLGLRSFFNFAKPDLGRLSAVGCVPRCRKEAKLADLATNGLNQTLIINNAR